MVAEYRGLLRDCEIFANLRLKLYCCEQTALSRAGVTYLYVGAVLLPVDLPAVYLDVGLAVVAWSRHEAGVGRPAPAPEILVTGHHSPSLLIMSWTLLLCVVIFSLIDDEKQIQLTKSPPLYYTFCTRWSEVDLKGE